MRTRLLGMVWFLVALLLFGLGVPLALSVASSEQQRLFLDRLTDTTRFATMAQGPFVEDRPGSLHDELHRYWHLYGVDVVVVNRDGEAKVSSANSIMPAAYRTPGVRDSIDAALAGRRPETGRLLLPWDDEPLVLASPVLVDGDVRGAVVTISPTAHIRAKVLLWWVVIAVGGVVAFGLALLIAVPVVQWVLRPVRRLDEATGSLVSAVVNGRAAERVGDSHGPPELRKLSRSFDQMAASVGDTLAAQRAFVADASHQLRNPLTALKLRLVNLEGHVDAEADAHREAAAAEADRLNRVLDDLLALARAEGTAGATTPVDVDEAVRDRAADWRVVAAARGIDLRVTGSAGGTRVLVPPRAIDGILDALLDNALKFSGPDTAVEVEVTPGEGAVDLAVRDHGPGLAPDELDRATDRFWRSAHHQNVPGSGLGLAIVQRIVTRCGGSLRLDLPDGGGLRVTASLPTA